MGPALVMQFYHDVKMVFIFIVTFMVGINIKDRYMNFSQSNVFITMMTVREVFKISKVQRVQQFGLKS